MEEWKDIRGYENRYQVSSNGRVRSLDRTTIGKNGIVFSYKGKVLKSKVSKTGGYEVVEIYNDGFREIARVHRLVAMEFIPNPLYYPIINHKDGNKLNNCVENLEWCTYKYNSNYSPLRQGHWKGGIC